MENFTIKKYGKSDIPDCVLVCPHADNGEKFLQDNITQVRQIFYHNGFI